MYDIMIYNPVKIGGSLNLALSSKRFNSWETFVGQPHKQWLVFLFFTFIVSKLTDKCKNNYSVRV